MLLTISTTHFPADDLGYLLHKNPARPQVFDLSFGRAHVFYPQSSPGACTAALLLEIDPVALAQTAAGAQQFALQQYVNDRPYVASSFMSVAIAQVFASALAGTSRQRAELAQTPIDLQACISVLPCRGGDDLLHDLFAPLGYTISATRHSLDEAFADWGQSSYYAVQLRNTLTLKQLLAHLYVLIPVLDDDKHYWVGDDEVAKLLRHGESWLGDHPHKQRIVERYLKHRHALARAALAQLLDEDQGEVDEIQSAQASEEQAVERMIDDGAPETDGAVAASTATALDGESASESAAGQPSHADNEPPIRLNDQRLDAVIAELMASGATSVLDLGCSGGNLIRRLVAEKQFHRIVGVDVSHRVLEIAAEKLHLDRLPAMQRQRIELLHGSLTYRDKRLAGFDAAAVVEVIEHLDEARLATFERVLFEFARPRTVLLTTPNIEYNVNFPTLPAGKLRHRDHRFEWTRQQFESWANRVASRFGYAVRFAQIGPVDALTGAPTQMAVFTLPAVAAGGANADGATRGA